jgi:hypothetical protein
MVEWQTWFRCFNLDSENVPVFQPGTRRNIVLTVTSQDKALFLLVGLYRQKIDSSIVPYAIRAPLKAWLSFEEIGQSPIKPFAAFCLHSAFFK